VQDLPFEQRVFPMVGYALPGRAELAGYCQVESMTAGLVERIVEVTEEAIGEPIRHTARKLFPKPLDRSILEEVELAWKASKRVLELSNKLSRENYVRITASRYPRPRDGAYPADWGQFSLSMKQDAPNALDVLRRLPTYAAMSTAFMARADSPEWWTSMEVARVERGLAHGALVEKLRFVSEAGWAIAERLGWGTYIGPRCAREFGSLDAAEIVRQEPDGGVTVWITAEPFDFRNEAHFARYAALREQLARHCYQGP
jgi:hypothetical protein